MTTSMNANSNMNAGSGIALLAVLVIVMAITVLALGFLSRSDVELACGRNMELRMQIDYLAESGLEHAKGLVLNPQDLASEYWTGGSHQQLVAGSSDFYDVVVVRDETDPANRCNYIIDCNAYRLTESGKIAQSNWRATLRVDPCIAFWAGAATTIAGQVTINGDVYCQTDLTNNGTIDGDAFACGSIAGTNIAGQSTIVPAPPVSWPGLVSGDFGPIYDFGPADYSAEIVDVNVHPAGDFAPDGTNPAGIRYCSGDIEMPGDVNITGMLVVEGQLTISGTNNRIIAAKNYPALLVTGGVLIKDGASLVISGLAQIGQTMTIEAGASNVDVDVTGALFVAGGGIEGTTSGSVAIDITTDPAIASIRTWPQINTAKRWGPAGGAFFKSIERR
ncbi:MAG: hypothetical protein ACYS7Y_23875 [Planctomycetota bacterium]